MSHSLKTTKGFTLIELLVVIAIIGILSSVVLASLSTARAKSRDARRISDLGQVQLALELYYDTNVAYPAAAAATTANYSALSTSLASATGTAYLPKMPQDPSAGASYFYGGSTTNYVLATILERGDNAALNTDADKTGSFTFDGTSTNCTNVAGTPRVNGVGTELCYDISN